MKYKMLEINHAPEIITQLDQPENEDYELINIISHRSLIYAFLKKVNKPLTQVEKMNAAKAAKRAAA